MILALAVVFVFTACDQDDGGKNIPEKYKNFYNYPDGRKSPTGTLEIKNSVNAPALLFTNDVIGSNYIGTVGSLGSIRVTLQEQKFYTIVAVDKASYEENSAQAGRFSDLTYIPKPSLFL